MASLVMIEDLPEQAARKKQGPRLEQCQVFTFASPLSGASLSLFPIAQIPGREGDKIDQQVFVPHLLGVAWQPRSSLTLDPGD